MATAYYDFVSDVDRESRLALFRGGPRRRFELVDGSGSAVSEAHATVPLGSGPAAAVAAKMERAKRGKGIAMQKRAEAIARRVHTGESTQNEPPDESPAPLTPEISRRRG